GRKFAGIRIGILRLKIARHHNVVADRHVVEAQRFALRDDPQQAVRLDQRAGGRCVEADLHGQRTFATTSLRKRRILSIVAARVGPNRPKSKAVTPTSCRALMSPTQSAAPPVNSLRSPSTVPFGCASGLDDTR